MHAWHHQLPRTSSTYKTACIRGFREWEKFGYWNLDSSWIQRGADCNFTHAGFEQIIYKSDSGWPKFGKACGTHQSWTTNIQKNDVHLLIVNTSKRGSTFNLQGPTLITLSGFWGWSSLENSDVHTLKTSKSNTSALTTKPMHQSQLVVWKLDKIANHSWENCSKNLRHRLEKCVWVCLTMGRHFRAWSLLFWVPHTQSHPHPKRTPGLAPLCTSPACGPQCWACLRTQPPPRHPCCFGPTHWAPTLKLCQLSTFWNTPHELCHVPSHSPAHRKTLNISHLCWIHSQYVI